jgi:hypothetical protein
MVDKRVIKESKLGFIKESKLGIPMVEDIII